ncbi:uncharacterized protein LOC121405687 isoform X3 [Lytechinus variegatus]|nr:uncharacterized protein LOC121405687 isoform X3 [Lytechinus variegatus]
MEEFIECNLHPSPHEDRFACWRNTTVCVCLITKTKPTDGDDLILVERNEPGGLHAEEILLKRIKENGYPGDAKIKLFLSYSPCNDEGHKCSTLLKELHCLFKQATIKFSGFYYIKRPSCISYGKCYCKTTNADSFPKLLELGASPIEKKDWDELIWMLTECDKQMQGKDETHTFSALNTIRSGEWYGEWRDWEDKRMMEDYNKMRDDELQSGIPRRRDVPPPGQPPRQPPLQEKGETAADMLAGKLDSVHVGN